MTSHNVELTMKDELTNKTVVRTIDKTNAMETGTVCWEMGNKESQRKNLESWITERGNEQHETILTITSWKFV